MELENCPKHTLNYWRQVNFFFLSPTNEDNYSQSALKSLFPLLSLSWQMKMVSGGLTEALTQHQTSENDSSILGTFSLTLFSKPEIWFTGSPRPRVVTRCQVLDHHRIERNPDRSWVENSGCRGHWWLKMLERKLFSLQCSVINPLLPDIKAFPFTSC